MEKNIAEIAGIGWQGKHSNIVSRKYTGHGCSYQKYLLI